MNKRPGVQLFQKTLWEEKQIKSLQAKTSR